MLNWSMTFFTPLEAETLDNQGYKTHKCWQERKSKIHNTHTIVDTYLLWMFISPPGRSSQLSIEFCGVFHPLMLLVTSPQTLLTKFPPSHHRYCLNERAKSLTPACPLFVPLTWPAHVCELSHPPAQLSARHHGMLLWAKCELLESTWHIWNSFAVRVKFLSKYHIQQEEYSWKYSSM